MLSANQALESRLHYQHKTSYFCPVCMKGDSESKKTRLTRFLRNLFTKAQAEWTNVNDYQVHTAVEHHDKGIDRPFIHYYLSVFHGEDDHSE